MSNLVSVVFFGFYSRFSSLLKTVPYISKSFRNGASTMFFAKTVDRFSRLFHYFRKKATALGSKYASGNKYRNLSKNASFNFILKVKERLARIKVCI